MSYKYNKLRGRIVEKFGSLSNFAKAIDLSEVALYKKINGKTGISQGDVARWSPLLDIETKDYGDFYFT